MSYLGSLGPVWPLVKLLLMRMGWGGKGYALGSGSGDVSKWEGTKDVPWIRVWEVPRLS